MFHKNSRPWIVGALLFALGFLGATDPPLRAQPPPASPLPPSPLPSNLDADGDSWYDRIEVVLGSNPGDRASRPESHALPDGDGNGVADACENFADDDGDGSTDRDDAGCTPPPLEIDLRPGVDIFQTAAKIEAGAFGPSSPPQRLELSGPAGVRRGAADRGTMPVTIDFQLAGRMGDVPVALVTNPARPSNGTVSSPSGQPPWSSRFEVHTLLVVGGQAGRTHPPITLENPEVPYLPPVQDSRKIDPKKCYRWSGGLHCPEVPRLRIPVLKWAAKFDCGEQPSTPPPFLGSVKPGDYATKIVIHNPQGVPVLVKKKVSVGERNPRTGPISPFKTVTLPPDGTTEVDCADIFFNLLGMQIPVKKPLPFLNGVVVLISQKKLDVIANYTQEVPKEKVDFTITPPPGAPPELRALAGRRLKVVTLVTEDTVVDEEDEVRSILNHYFPPAQIKKSVIKILGDSVGVGAGIDVEEIRPQRCILEDPPELPDGTLVCEPSL